jgi:hypothetical protein
VRRNQRLVTKRKREESLLQRVSNVPKNCNTWSSQTNVSTSSMNDDNLRVNSLDEPNDCFCTHQWRDWWNRGRLVNVRPLDLTKCVMPIQRPAHRTDSNKWRTSFRAAKIIEQVSCVHRVTISISQQSPLVLKG